MSNGDPPPVSSSPYIIICSRRTQVKLAKDAGDIVMAASLAAAEVCSFMEMKFHVKAEDMVDITKLQHDLMEGASAMKKAEAEAAAAEMFDLLTVLEHEFGEHDY